MAFAGGKRLLRGLGMAISLSIGKLECQLLWQSRPLVLQDEVMMPSFLTKPAPNEKQLVQGTRPFWVLVLGLESESRSASVQVVVDTHSSLGPGYLLSTLHSSVFSCRLIALCIVIAEPVAAWRIKSQSINPRPLFGGFATGLFSESGRACWWLHQVRFLESARAGAILAWVGARPDGNFESKKESPI